jgi:hypothetical protein
VEVGDVKKRKRRRRKRKRIWWQEEIFVDGRAAQQRATRTSR